MLKALTSLQPWQVFKGPYGKEEMLNKGPPFSFTTLWSSPPPPPLIQVGKLFIFIVYVNEKIEHYFSQKYV